MKDFIRSFNERIEEIDGYFDFVEKIDSIESHKREEIVFPNSEKYSINSNLQKMLRANCFLMLYNLIESSIRNGIIAIYDAIHDEGLTYNDISDNIKDIWLDYKCDNLTQMISKKAVLKTVNKILKEVVENEIIFFEKNNLPISGNLDEGTIQKLIDQYKFYGEIRNNSDHLKFILSNIKKKRNDLAHGNISFREGAKDITITTLLEFKKETIEYIQSILHNIENYIDNKKFKKMN